MSRFTPSLSLSQIIQMPAEHWTILSSARSPTPGATKCLTLSANSLRQANVKTQGLQQTDIIGIASFRICTMCFTLSQKRENLPLPGRRKMLPQRCDGPVARDAGGLVVALALTAITPGTVSTRFPDCAATTLQCKRRHVLEPTIIAVWCEMRFLAQNI